MKKAFRQILLSLLVVLASSYSLQGEWKLKNLDGQSTDKGIVLKIDEKVILNGEIRNTLTFKNCLNITYQVNVNQNLMLLDDNAENNNNSNNTIVDNKTQCTQQSKTLQKRIAQALKKVFFFAIKSDLLVFVSPNGNDLFQFQRVKKVYLTDLIGTWLLDKLYWQRALLTKASIEKQKAYFCDGKIETTYETNHIDEISFKVVRNNNCQQTNLSTALGHIRYYRLKDVELELYDENSVEIMQMAYTNQETPIKQTQVIVPSTSSSIKGGSVTIIQGEQAINLIESGDHNLRTQN